MRSRRETPNIRKVGITPYRPRRSPARLPVMSAEIPNPRRVSPRAVPRRSGNQRAARVRGTP
jgi:hypothetical protein